MWFKYIKNFNAHVKDLVKSHAKEIFCLYI